MIIGLSFINQTPQLSPLRWRGFAWNNRDPVHVTLMIGPHSGLLPADAIADFLFQLRRRCCAI
jgi:hypothetical protein